MTGPVFSRPRGYHKATGVHRVWSGLKIPKIGLSPTVQRLKFSDQCHSWIYVYTCLYSSQPLLFIYGTVWTFAILPKWCLPFIAEDSGVFRYLFNQPQTSPHEYEKLYQVELAIISPRILDTWLLNVILRNYQPTMTCFLLIFNHPKKRDTKGSKSRILQINTETCD